MKMLHRNFFMALIAVFAFVLSGCDANFKLPNNDNQPGQDVPADNDNGLDDNANDNQANTNTNDNQNNQNDDDDNANDDDGDDNANANTDGDS